MPYYKIAIGYNIMWFGIYYQYKGNPESQKVDRIK